MQKYVALLRGVNVGGRNKIPMQSLKEICAAMGWQNVQSYLQSGNLIFEAQNPDANLLSIKIQTQFGFKPKIMILSKSEFIQIAQACPFNSQTGKDVHIYFLDTPSSNPPKVDHSKLSALQSPSEKWAIGENAFYLFAPDGVHSSKLANGAEKALGAPATARNWNTVQKLYTLLAQ